MESKETVGSRADVFRAAFALTTRLTKAEARVRELEDVIRNAYREASEAPELNMANYDVDDVARLNGAMMVVWRTLQPYADPNAWKERATD